MSRNPGFIQLARMVTVLLFLIVLLPLMSVISFLLILISFGRLRNFLVYWTGVIFGRPALYLAGVRLNIHYHGVKPKGPAVFLFNHSSTLDLFIIVSLMLPPARFIAKREFKYNPFFWIMNNLLGNIMIDRRRSRAAAIQLQKAFDHLKKNKISLVFAPEGTRSSTGEIGTFKSGAFHAALELGYSIIPIYIEGAYKLCPGKSLITRPGEVNVHFYPPIDTSGWENKQLRTHINEVRAMYIKWNGPQQDIPAEEAKVH
jgi:1-acyl-sn-glycerol-3-phosphate acyltransferase